MFEVLFIYPKVLARHQAGPAAVDRERYLTRCGGQGAAHGPLLRIARELATTPARLLPSSINIAAPGDGAASRHKHAG